MAAWLKSLPKPTAIFACNDDRAVYVLEACKSSGINVPEEVVYEVFKKTHTVYENYAPESYTIGIHAGNPAKADFVGWTGCGPIQLLFENVMGLRPDGAQSHLVWKLRRTDQHGVEKFKLGKNTISVICQKRKAENSEARITVECEKPFQLTLIRQGIKKTVELKKGKEELTF